MSPKLNIKECFRYFLGQGLKIKMNENTVTHTHIYSIVIITTLCERHQSSHYFVERLYPFF